MQNITEDELQEIVRNHEVWLNDKTKGLQANLENANLEYADLENVNLKYANLENANLEYADLENVNLKYANLENANLEYANLEYANLENANLRYANLENADLKYANLENANLENANLYNSTGNNGLVRTIQTGTYIINYTNTIIQIGCESHAIHDWFCFTDNDIIKMDGAEALKFWRKWKSILQQLIENK